MKFAKTLLPLLSVSLLTSCGTLRKLASYADVSEESLSQTTSRSSSSRSTTVTKEAKYSVVGKKYFLEEGSTSGQSRCLDVLIQVKNTGTADLYLDSGDVNLVDPSGTKMFSNDLMLSYAPTTVLPGETGYFYLSSLQELDMSKTYTIKEKLKIQRAVSEAKRFTTSDVTLKDHQYTSGFDVSFTLTNQYQSATSNWTCMDVILFDNHDEPFAIYDGSITDNLSAGEKRNVNSLYEAVNIRPNLKVADIKRYEVVAYEYKMFNI